MPSALVLHGVGSGPATMWRVAEWLRDAGWDIVAPALLGHGGRGPAPRYTLGAFADDVLEHGDHDLVLAHSLGGSIAALIAGMHPDWTRRLVLMEPALWLPPATLEVAAGAEALELEWDEDRIRAECPRWEDRDIAAKAAAAAKVLPEAVHGAFEQNPDWDLTESVLRIAVPTLLLTGDERVYTLTPFDRVAEVVQRNPRVDWEFVPGTGHSPHRDDPAGTQTLLMGWLTGA